MQNKKIKILYISRISKITGAESILLDIAGNLDRKQFHPVVVIPDKKGPLYERLFHAGIETKVIWMPFLRVTYNPFLLLWFLLCIPIINIIFLFFIMQNNIDIISSNTIQEAFYTAFMAKISRRKLVINFKNILNTRWKKIIRAKFAGAFADKVVAVSQKAAQDFSSFNEEGKNRKKLTVVYDCLDYEEYTREIRRENLDKFFIRKPEDIIIVNIGSLSELKGQAFLIEAIAGDKMLGENIKVVIVGEIYNKRDRPYEDKLKKLIEKNDLGNRVFLVGYNNNVRGILSSTDVLIHCPVIDDALPRVILEGFATRNIVIGTRVGGIPEMIRDGYNGFLVDIDKDMLADKILYVCENRYNLEKIKENAMSVLLERFNLKKQLDHTERLYRKLINV